MKYLAVLVLSLCLIGCGAPLNSASPKIADNQGPQSPPPPSTQPEVAHCMITNLDLFSKPERC
jgi:hypothetical protein